MKYTKCARTEYTDAPQQAPGMVVVLTVIVVVAGINAELGTVLAQVYGFANAMRNEKGSGCVAVEEGRLAGGAREVQTEAIIESW